MRCAQSTIRRFCLALPLLLVAAESAAAGLERLVMPGPVASFHAEVEDSCESCHSPLDDRPQEALCVTCHEGVGEDLANGTGLHGLHPEVAVGECQRCHREHEGREATTLEFDWQRFDHDQTDFPLRWAHGGLACESCHAPDVLEREAPATCDGCHADDDPHDGGLGPACESCHWERSWEAPRFEHAATGFALEGAHAALTCAACHSDARFHEAEASCVGCHADDDAHDGTFGTQCAACHGTFSWTESFFDHARSTGFALSGGHAGLSCDSCHGGEPLTALEDASCSGCHKQDDVHEGRNGSLCEGCHSTDNWQSRFDHLARTGFALPGVHAELSCTSCHTGPLSEPVARECRGCHEDVHGGQLGPSCGSCHGDWSWTDDVRFGHALTNFPLLGRHAQLACSDCHASARFHDAQATCKGCHAADDVHAGTVGEDCASCHTPLAWRSTTFDHGQHAAFVLEGAHREIACQSCHGSPRLLAVPRPEDCGQCHAHSDVHEGRFGNDCGRCHGTERFAAPERL